MPIPDWQLPAGVDRGLWDYLHADDMVAGYDEQVRASPLASADVAYCDRMFPTPGRLIDLGCGTGRLCSHFADRGYECVGVDLSDEMLAKARENWNREAPSPASKLPAFIKGNLVDLGEFPTASFDYSACLFSTLGMVRGAESRAQVVTNVSRLLRPGGRFVLHAHNRYFQGLGWRRVIQQALRSLRGDAGDITMPQAYGGATLTLHHFSRSELVQLVEGAGFSIREALPIGPDGQRASYWWRVYGWLIACERR